MFWVDVFMAIFSASRQEYRSTFVRVFLMEQRKTINAEIQSGTSIVYWGLFIIFNIEWRIGGIERRELKRRFRGCNLREQIKQFAWPPDIVFEKITEIFRWIFWVRINLLKCCRWKFVPFNLWKINISIEIHFPRLSYKWNDKWRFRRWIGKVRRSKGRKEWWMIPPSKIL